MRVLLIRPAQIRWSDEAPRVGTAIGLLSVAAVLEREHDIAVIDAVAEGYDSEREVSKDVFRFGLSDAEVLSRIDQFRPDVVGITNSFTLYWGTTWELIRSIKRHAPGVLTILGGHHASEAAHEILEIDRERVIDYIVLKEGDASVLELLRALEQRREPLDMAGIAWRDASGEVHVQKTSGWIQQLDDLPDPAWHLVRTSHYRREMSHYGAPRSHNFLDMMFSRGCPVGCSFCTSTTYWGKRFRVFSEERIREQLTTVKALGWQEIVLEDDNFLALPLPTQKYIASALRDTGLPWCNDGGLYLPMIDEQHIEILAESGCYRVFVPVESPSMDVMHGHHKYLMLRSDRDYRKRVLNATRLLRAAGLEFYCGLMVGFPGQSDQSIEATISFGRFLSDECGAFVTAYHWVHEYPGTRIYGARDEAEPTWHRMPEHYSFTRPQFERRNELRIANALVRTEFATKSKTGLASISASLALRSERLR